MTNQSFTNEEIFEDRRLNGICDRMFTAITAKFPAQTADVDNDFVFKRIILSGKAAEILQNPKIEAAKNVIFQTDNVQVFDYLVQKTSVIFNCKVVKLKDRLLFYPQNFIFEVWFSTSIDPVLESGIWLQNITEIPEILL